MIPFLKAVAKAYSSRYSDLSEFCFLFPNKRSGTFFLKYLKEESGFHTILAPEIKTITEFVADLSERVVASRLDLIFSLYECYCELRNISHSEDPQKGAEDFEQFRSWGETVLSDFNEVDQYLADVESVFKNVKDFREISTNFLTEDQRSVMNEYFGRSETGDPSKFWRNFDKEEDQLSEVKRSFLYLWRSLLPLYNALNEKLASRGLITPGGAYRLAVENLKEKGRDMLPYKKIIAVGFNALSGAEASLFLELRDFDGFNGYDDFADFFWDATGPVFSSGINSASRFVKTNLKKFPSPQWAIPAISLSDSSEMPKLKIVASPSNSAQVKIAGNVLGHLRQRLSAEEISQAKVAMVLPDENLLLPMLYSLPAGMGDVNLTMGYPLRLTSVIPFVRLLKLLNRNRKGVGQGASFYHRDLRLFLSHPFSHAAFGTLVINHLIGYIDKHHKTTVSLKEIRDFTPLAAEMIDLPLDTITGKEAVNFLDSILRKIMEAASQNGTDMLKSRLEVNHIQIYRDALRRLGELLEEYHIPTNLNTIFQLADRLLAGTTVGFEGEPLTGLQVMGTLETRSIDFDHLIILSMNERIMPLRARTKSFIPDSLRLAYGMPPSNYAESIFAYYFYRMISRAKEVTLIYDARSGGGLQSGDVSRYILQLRHLFASASMEEQKWKFILSGKDEYDPSVEKTEEIRKRLEDYLHSGPGAKNFSASALNAYRECQVRFFYQQVLGINTEAEPSDFIDAIGVGNILHALMEHLYLPEEMRKKYLDIPVMIQKETIDALLSDRENLKRLTTRLINQLHYNLPKEKLDTPLSGASEIVGRQILEQAVRVMRRDKELAPFKIYGCEIKKTLRIPLKSGRTVNFKFAIDRLDEITVNGKPQLRIVDYKTGKIKLEAQSMDEVFNGDYRSSQVFQLLTYAWLLCKMTGKSEDVRMEIYDVPKIWRKEENLPKIENIPITSFQECEEEFSSGMETMINSVFDGDFFDAIENEEECSLCRLRMLCRR